MNKDRRQQLEKLIGELDDIKNQVEALRDEEQDYYDNMPESLQGGEKGDIATEAISQLDEAISNIEYAIDNIETAGS